MNYVGHFRNTISVILVVHIPSLFMKATNSRFQNQLVETTCSMTLLQGRIKK